MSGQATVTIQDKQWTCQVANTPTELETGLSNTPSLPAGQGMLFDLGYSRLVTVNAYAMAYSIAVVFIDEDMKVNGFAPMLIPGYDVTTVLPCRYFLEVNYDDVGDPQPQLGADVTITGYTSPVSISTLIGLMVTMMIVTMMMKAMSKVVKEVK